MSRINPIGLDEIANNPRCVNDLSAKAIQVLNSRLAMVHGALAARLIALNEPVAPTSMPSAPAAPPQQDRLLRVDEAAQQLGIARDTLYRNADEYPFTRRPRPHALRFSELGIAEFRALKKTADEWR